MAAAAPIELDWALQTLEARKARTDLSYFIREAWPVVEPAKAYVHNWHIDAIAAHLEAVTRGQIRRLLINIPPGHAKSLLVSVLWPAWVWVQDTGLGAKWRAIFATYSSDLSLRDSVKCRMLIESEWYQRTFEPRWTLSDVQNAKGNFLNSKMGFRLATSVGGRGTGFRGDCVVADDPLNAKEAHSPAARNEVITWWDTVMSSRLDDKAKGAMVIIMQRLHEQDLAGHVLERGGYEHLCLPSEFDPKRRSTTSLGGDPRKRPGQLLFPALFPRSVIEEAKIEMGSAAYAGQHQQLPSPEGGGILKDFWWRYWQPKGASLSPITVRMANGELKEIKPVELPEKFDEIVQSWDCSFKDVSTSDYVVGQVWGRKGGDRFLLDQVRDRLDVPGTITAVRNLSVKHPRAQRKLVEDKANGPAVIQMLQHELPGLIGVNPEGNKIQRTYAASPQIEAGNVYLPHPAHMAWVDGFIAECSAFPAGTNDDQVDACSQALNHFAMAPRPRIRSLNLPYEED